MNKKTVITVGVTVLICVFLFGGALLALNYQRWFGDAPQNSSGEQAVPGEQASPAGKMKIDSNAGEYVAPEPVKTESAGIAIPGWGYISIPENETEIAVDFPNPEENDGKYYLSFELRLKDNGEVLYTSGLVPPGQTIQKITLPYALSEGSYKAVVHVQPYKMDEAQTPTNNADMETELVVFKQ